MGDACSSDVGAGKNWQGEGQEHAKKTASSTHPFGLMSVEVCDFILPGSVKSSAELREVFAV